MILLAAHPRRPADRRAPAPRSWAARALVLWLAFAALAGCAHVPPYAREELTRPGMESESEAEEDRFRSHVYDAREGAAGGHGSTGGGCGCN
ncbi:MAG: DUF4266 domain-containing protein [Polyangiales bacterium]